MIQLAESIARKSRQSAVIDLAVLIAFFAACYLSLPVLGPVLRRGRGLAIVLAAATYQFTFEGLAPLLIMASRREHFSDYGFTRHHAARSLALGITLAAIYDLALSWHTGALLWIPLRRQPAVHISLAAGFPQCLVGLAATVLAWGFFEGFFGVYFAKKVNVAFDHTGLGWFSPGALAFALFNASIHLTVGQGMEGFVTSLASGYAIAVIPAITENAWGSALVQTLTDATGKL